MIFPRLWIRTAAIQILTDMDKITHAELVRDILKYLHSQGCVSVLITPRGRKGPSDILFCYRGRFGAVEAKVGYDTPSPHQKRFLKEVIDAEGQGGICRSVDDVKRILKRILLHIKAGL